ncbi:MAG: hypothetical protein KKD18_02560 [Nanoarchaeota archaeon]|nr:hypothetical protein [Nanoarchaeota archaeon]MBU0977273.1 hypothetical protein [Nanoarchaeota archaeon]
MIIQIRIKKNCPKTYLEKVTRDKYMAYLSRSVEETEIDDVLTKLVSKEFFSPLQKIILEAADPENRIVEIL